VSQRKRKRVEEVFGWMKTIALQRKTRFRGPDRVGWMFTFAQRLITWYECGTSSPTCLKHPPELPGWP